MPRRSIKALFFVLTGISLVLLLLGSVVLYRYITATTHEKMLHLSHDKTDHVRHEIIRFYDQMSHDFLLSEAEQTKKMALAQRYFDQYGIDAPLEPLKKLLSDTLSVYDVSLINRDMVIERTTFAPDQDLDFKYYRHVPQLFASLFASPDKMDLSKPYHESSSGTFKRYSVQASHNGHYLIQLGQAQTGVKSLSGFMSRLEETFPTLHSQAVFTVYSTDDGPTAVKEIWSQRMLEMRKNDMVKIWDGSGDFQKMLIKIDPASKPLFKYPKLFLYPHLNVMFKNDIRKDTTYWKNGHFYRLVMLPYQSYYQMREKSYAFVVLEFDETGVYNQIALTKTIFFCIWGAIAALLLFMIGIFYRRIIVPITTLQTQMSHKIPIDLSNVPKDDEITKMSRTYNWLLNDLKHEIRTNQILFEQFKTFTANAIHQVRTPLSVIKISLASLSDQPALKETTLHIHSSVITMEHLYDSLAFTLHHDTIDLPVHTIDVSQILHQRIELFSPVAASIDSAILLEARAGITYEMNPTELEFLIDNNLSNAFKYGIPRQSVCVSLSQSPREIILSFENYGKPIPNTDQIFDRYVRIDNSKQGTGLGLNIVSTICKRYDIFIRVTHEGGKNCFRYYFPLGAKM